MPPADFVHRQLADIVPGQLQGTLAPNTRLRVRRKRREAVAPLEDRQSETYKQLYAKRTMVERINSQAEALDIIHPKLRSGRAIANRNTLTYVLINLRALMRIRSAALEGRPEAEQLTLAA